MKFGYFHRNYASSRLPVRFSFLYCLPVVLALAQPSTDPNELLARAEQLADVYNWYDAEPLYAQAELAFRDSGDRRNTFFAQVSRLRGEMQIRAFPDLIQSIDSILASDIAKSDKRLRLRCLIVRGDVNLEMDTPAAKEDWEAALALATDIGDPKWQSRAKGELGMIAFMLGDTKAAFAKVSQALFTARIAGDIGAEIRYYSAIATGLGLTAEYEQAIRYFDLALNTAAKHPETGFQYISIWGKANALLRLGRIDEAERLVREALAQADADDRRVKKVQLLVAASDIARARLQPVKAIEYLEQALPIAEHGEFKRLLADIYFDLTELDLQNGKILAAGRYADSALRLAEEVGDRYSLPSQLLILAKVKNAEGKRTTALEYLDHATDIVDSLLVNAGNPTRAAMLIDAMSSIYAYQFDLAVENHMPASYAFTVVERARGRVLSDVITLGRPADDGPPSPERRRLERELSRLQRSLLALNLRVEREAALERIWQVEQEMARIEAPFSHWVIRREHSLSLAEFQRGLSPEEAVVEYVFTEDALFALTISQNSTSISRIGKRDEIERVARTCTERLQTLTTYDDRAAAAMQAYRMLLAPLKGIGGKSGIIVIPDGVLNGVAFDILESSTHGSSSPKPTFSFAPSATALYGLRKARTSSEPDLPLLAVGDVPYTLLAKTLPNPSRGGGIFDALRRPELASLPGSRTEVENAAHIFAPGSVELLGNDATEGRFKKEPLHRYAIIHLAVHGFADPKEPQRAALLLAPDPSSDEDGFLQPREISQLRIAAKLVVLSACSTGVGRSFGEEGIANLSRSFLLAGASAVVTTLWAVSDTGSTTLMTEFYRNLHSGQSVASALENAKEAMLSRFGPEMLPTIAAFQVIGNGNVTVRLTQASPIQRAQP